MSQEWYYSVDGDRQGPVSAQELKKLVDAGSLKPTDLVWKDGMADWVPAKSIKGLFAAGASSAGTPAAESKPAKTAEKEKSASSAFDNVTDDDEDDRPRKKREVARRDDDDEEEDEPRRRRSRDDDEEEDEPRRPKKRKRGGGVPSDVSGTKVTAGLLAILLGGWGVHKFYLGMSGAGVLQIVITFLTCGLGGIIALVEGIMYLTKSDEDFYETYIVGQKAWF